MSRANFGLVIAAIASGAVIGIIVGTVIVVILRTRG